MNKRIVSWKYDEFAQSADDTERYTVSWSEYCFIDDQTGEVLTVDDVHDATGIATEMIWAQVAVLMCETPDMVETQWELDTAIRKCRNELQDKLNNHMKGAHWLIKCQHVQEVINDLADILYLPHAPIPE